MLFFCCVLLSVCHIIRVVSASYLWDPTEVLVKQEWRTNITISSLEELLQHLRLKLGADVNGTTNMTGIAIPTICPSYNDGLLIWPITAADSVVELPCADIEDLSLSEGYATRECLSNGSWVMADYGACLSYVNSTIDRLDEEDKLHLLVIRTQTNVSYILLSGFCLSSLSMILAIMIFIKFKQFKCLKNLIHCQLLIAMTLKNLIWIIMYIWILHGRKMLMGPVNCILVFALHRFFLYATFSWMFVEGFYLYLNVVKAFKASQFKRLHCAAIGWGVPTITTLIWVPMQITHQHREDPGCYIDEKYTYPPNIYDMVIISTMLVVNVLFMTTVIYTLVTKLQHRILNQGRQYRKAVRATVILIPLLGGAYLFCYITPITPNKSLYGQIWSYTNATLQSTQGFVVALVYCFLTREVKSAVKKLHRRWKDEKSLPSLAGQWWASRRRSSATPTSTTTM